MSPKVRQSHERRGLAILIDDNVIDIGSPDPEQMSPIQIVNYLESIFKNDKNVTMTVVDDIDVIGKQYPLAHAVARASLVGKSTVHREDMGSLRLFDE